MKASEIAFLLNGILYGEDKEIKNIKKPSIAKKEDIAFIFPGEYNNIGLCEAGVIVLEKEEVKGRSFILIKDVKEAFRTLIKIFYPEPVKRIKGISERAYIGDAKLEEDVAIGDFTYVSDGVNIGKRTIIYPNVFIGSDVKIGNDCVLYPHVTIYDKTEIGNNVILHSGVVVGSDGFGYFEKNGKREKIVQAGYVIIKDNVEIGANTTIDRATIGETIIEEGTKIDNLVQIAHNVEIGKDVVIVSQTGIAGSVKIGDRVIIAGQVGISDHIVIEDDSILLAQSGVMRNVKKGSIVCGTPAIDRVKFFRERALISRLEEIFERVKKLEKK